MTKPESQMADRGYTDDEIRSFVADLESLPSGDLTVALLVGCGQRAVEPLRDFLLNGKPRGVFQPRQRAVEALGQLGAKEVLLEYLSQRREIPDPVVRFGEEAVENTAARELASWRTDEVFHFLMNLGQQRMLPGVVDALREFDRPAAAPLFLRALEDDVCRRIAEEGLRRVATMRKQELFDAARPSDSDFDENPSERQRRRSVVRILSELDLGENDWDQLRPLLDDRDEEIAIIAAEMAVDWAPAGEKQAAARVLISCLAWAHWFLQIRIQDCLRRNYPQLREMIYKESTLRRRMAKGEPLADPVLRILEKLQSSAEKPGPKEDARHAK